MNLDNCSFLVNNENEWNSVQESMVRNGYRFSTAIDQNIDILTLGYINANTWNSVNFPCYLNCHTTNEWIDYQKDKGIILKQKLIFWRQQDELPQFYKICNKNKLYRKNKLERILKNEKGLFIMNLNNLFSNISI